MYEMSKMTLEQEEVRNQEYNEYVEQMTPKHNLWANMGKAFLLGGGICLLGQIILQIAAGVFGLKAEDAALWCSLLLVLLSVILTSCKYMGFLPTGEVQGHWFRLPDLQMACVLLRWNSRKRDRYLVSDARFLRLPVR